MEHTQQCYFLKNGSRQINYPKYFVDIDKEECNMNVGQQIWLILFEFWTWCSRKKIPENETLKKNLEKFIYKNPCSVFLTAVYRKEIFEIVMKCKNKKSCNWYGCSKKCHWWNCKLFIWFAKVMAYLYNSRNKHDFTNFRPVSLLQQFSKILKNFSITNWTMS